MRSAGYRTGGALSSLRPPPGAGYHTGGARLPPFPPRIHRPLRIQMATSISGALNSATAAFLCRPRPIASSPYLSHSPISLRRPIRPLRVRAARMYSGPVSIGFQAPNFELPEPMTGKTWTLGDFESHPGLLVMFICNHCPFVKLLKKDISRLTDFYMKKGLAAVAISSNSVTVVPQDGPDFMREEAKEFNYPFPYLYDESQDVARAFGAVCTPEFFLFKKDERQPFELYYHGQYDVSRPGNDIAVTGKDLSSAIETLLSGKPLSITPEPSLGCSIKWHPKS